MNKLLDMVFCNRKLSIGIPLIVATIALILAVAFGNPVSVTNAIITGVLISTVSFFGVYFILLIQIKNPSCPEWFLNTFELVAIIIFSIYALIHLIIFIISGFSSFNIILCVGLVGYSATAWAHSKRK